MAPTSPRQMLVLLHRYVGLTLAFFMLLTAATGSVLAWYDELDALVWSGVAKVEPPSPTAQPMDPLEIRERVIAREPNVSHDFVQLDKGRGQPLLFDLIQNETNVDNELWINPYTGEETGRREWGNAEQGTKNLLPFLFRLHRSLALGSTGEFLLGVIALLWILNCFTGAYLTFPAAPPYLKRWRPAWLINRKRLSYDLHRASGLWLWAMMLVFAWAAVSFNLSKVYSPVTAALLEYRDHASEIPDLPEAKTQPRLSFRAARDRGRMLASQYGASEDFVVTREDAISYEPSKGLYRYRMTTDRDVWKDGGASELWFDADTGGFLKLKFPTQQSSGNTVTTWLQGLHRARVGGGLYQVFVTAMGAVVFVFTLAGVIVWWRKRQSLARVRTVQASAAAD